MKFRNKKHILFFMCTAAVFLAIGFLGGKRYVALLDQDILDVALSQQESLKSAYTVMNAQNMQYSSCLDAYKEVSACLINKNCDLQKSGEKLKILEIQRASAEETIKIENEKIPQIGKVFESSGGN